MYDNPRLCLNCYFNSNIQLLIRQISSLLCKVDLKPYEKAIEKVELLTNYFSKKVDNNFNKIDDYQTFIKKIKNQLNKINEDEDIYYKKLLNEILIFDSLYDYEDVDNIKNIRNIIIFVNVKNIYDKINNENITFNSINQCIKYLCANGFTKCNSKNIKIELHCDGLSGYKYKDVNDFVKRIDSKDYEKYDNILNVDDFCNSLTKIPYFLYIEDPLYFKNLNKEMIKYYKNNKNEFTVSITEKEYSTIPQIANLVNKLYNIKETNLMEFRIKNFIYQEKHYIKENTLIPIPYYYYNKVHEFYKITDSDKLKLKEILKNKMKSNSFKMDYKMFMLEYNNVSKSFLVNQFPLIQNYYDNVNNIIKLYKELHNLYPNSSLEGTKYHVNVMINRNIFLKDPNYFKIFVDDDDFTNGLDNYNHNINLYKQKIKELFPSIRNSIIACLKNISIKNKTKMKKIPENIIDFQKFIYNYFMKTPINRFDEINNRIIYHEYSKFYINFLSLKLISNKFSFNHVYGFWSCIIIPYMLFPIVNVQETSGEDVGFKLSHLYNNNNDDKDSLYLYNYLTKSQADYNDDDITHKHSENSVILNIDNHIFKYDNQNKGRYYYKYDSLVECLKYNDKTGDFTESIEFVCERNRKITKKEILLKYTLEQWNDKLSDEYLLDLH